MVSAASGGIKQDFGVNRQSSLAYAFAYDGKNFDDAARRTRRIMYDCSDKDPPGPCFREVVQRKMHETSESGSYS